MTIYNIRVGKREKQREVFANHYIINLYISETNIIRFRVGCKLFLRFLTNSLILGYGITLGHLHNRVINTS